MQRAPLEGALLIQVRLGGFPYAPLFLSAIKGKTPKDVENG